MGASSHLASYSLRSACNHPHAPVSYTRSHALQVNAILPIPVDGASPSGDGSGGFQWNPRLIGIIAGEHIQFIIPKCIHLVNACPIICHVFVLSVEATMGSRCLFNCAIEIGPMLNVLDLCRPSHIHRSQT